MRRLIDSGVLAVLTVVLAFGFLVQVPKTVDALPAIDYVVIVDAPGGAGSWVSGRNYMFGDNDAFWAAGYNKSSGWVADIPGSWHFYQSGVAMGNNVIRTNTSYSSSVKVFTNGYGVAYLSVDVNGGGQNQTVSNTTGPLRVDVSNVNSTIIRFEQGGMGTWVGPTTYELNDHDTFYAAAYDLNGYFLGDIISNWTSTDSRVIYLYSPGGISGGCDYTHGQNGSTCYPMIGMYATSLGHAYVNATPVGTILENVTGRLTVAGTTIDYIQIRNAPNNGGQVLGTGTYYVREQDTFYAASYNHTLGYRGDVVGDWTSSNSAVCEVKGYSGAPAHGSSVQVLMKTPGICTVTVNATTISGPVTNTTDDLTVLSRTTLTVDAGGGKDYTRIQDAVDNASDGYTIEVYPSTYHEHVVVNKEIEIIGMDRTGVILDGGGTGTALYLGADRIVIHNFTILNAVTGIFNDQTNNTRLYEMTIKDYVVGLNNSLTLNAWVAHSLIRDGEIGVVAYKAYDDAVRWNEIAYNTRYGGKGYDAHMRNCFNWNSLHHNKIGYYYDPTLELPPMEFDGNLIVDNEVGVKVENTSAISLTQNAISGGQEGVQLLNSSSAVGLNIIVDVDSGIRFLSSNSNITGNMIRARVIGISGEGGAPLIEGNDIEVLSGDAMSLTRVYGAVIRNNNVHGGTIHIRDSHISVLAPIDSIVILEDTIVDTLVLDPTSRVEVRWTIRVEAVDANDHELGGCSVTARNVQGELGYSGTTNSDGFTHPFTLTTKVLTFGSVLEHNPFTFEVSSGPMSASIIRTISESSDIVITLRERAPAGLPFWFIATVILISFASLTLAGIFGIERSRYSFFTLLIPLYTRLNRENPFDNLNRGRVYGYIELNPGAHFNMILAALDLNNGTLVYHLEVLQRDGFVTSRQDGMYRRFYPKGVKPPLPLENGTSETQTRILKAIQEMPGITQKELVRLFGLRQSTLAYQMERLESMGYIAAEKRGRKVHYTAKERTNRF